MKRIKQMHNKPILMNLKSALKRKGVLPLVIILLGALIQLNNANFLTLDNLANVLRQISILAVVAFGMTIVIISGGIDLSVGSIIGLTCVVASPIMKDTNSIALGILIALIVGAAAGALNGLIVTVSGVHPFVVTLGTLTAYKGLAMIYSNGYLIGDLPRTFLSMATESFLGLPVLIWITFGVFWAVWFLLNKTKLGLNLYEMGGREEAAVQSGINVKGNKILVYMLSGLCSGLAGMMLVSRVISASATLGAGYHLEAIAAAVIGGASLGGGKGTVGGTVLGIILLGVISNGLNLLKVSTFWQIVAIGSTIVIAVMFDTLRQRGAAEGGVKNA